MAPSTQPSLTGRRRRSPRNEYNEILVPAARRQDHPILQVAVYDGIESVNKIIELLQLMNLPCQFVRMPDRCPGQINWHYDRAEIIADGVVHAIGVCLGLIGAVTIVVMAVKIERINVAAILVYVIGLVTMLAFSAAYNMWPTRPSSGFCAASTTPRFIY